jgi:twinfilin-like protein
MASSAAKLFISPLLTAAFRESSPPPRTLLLKINDETIDLVAADGDRSQDAGFNAAFDQLSAVLQPDDAAFALIHTSLNGVDQPNKAEWLLVTWIPDNARVRDKMLYSSSKEHLKKELGSTSFLDSDYYANELTDLRASSYTDGLVHTLTLNARELELQAEKETIVAEGAQTKKTAGMAEISFGLNSEAIDSLAAFKAGSVNACSLTLEDNCIIGVTPGFDATGLTIGGVVSPLCVRDATEPSFLLVKTPKGTKFVYACPESSHVRLKMSYSTAKSACLNEIRGSIPIDKVLEICEYTEIDDALREEESEEGSGNGAGLVKDLAIKKPSRPGRGKARLIAKFNPEE